MTVTIIQTADAIFYEPMLAETSKTARAFCIENGFAYEQYIGVKRGHMPWHASYNRVYMLKEMLDRGVRGWVLYLDADAYIHDMDFDLAEYFRARSSAAAIFAGYGTCEIATDINSGGFAINLSDPVGQSIVLDWHRSVDRVPDEAVHAAVDWEHDLANDQHLLSLILSRYVDDRKITRRIIFERSNESYVNNGPFIAQQLRTMHRSFPERLDAIRQQVAKVLEGRPKPFEGEGPGIYLTAHHPRWLTTFENRTDFGIETVGREGLLLFGPFIRLKAGSHLARLFGAARTASHLHIDVAINRGFDVLGEKDVQISEGTRGLMVEMPFELAESTDSLEFRVSVDAAATVSVHAVQIVTKAAAPPDNP